MGALAIPVTTVKGDGENFAKHSPHLPISFSVKGVAKFLVTADPELLRGRGFAQ